MFVLHIHDLFFSVLLILEITSCTGFNADDDDELVVDEYITVNDTNDDPTADEKPGVHLTGTFSKDSKSTSMQKILVFVR